MKNLEIKTTEWEKAKKALQPKLFLNTNEPPPILNPEWEKIKNCFLPKKPSKLTLFLRKII